MTTIPFPKNEWNHGQSHWQTGALIVALRRKTKADKKARDAYLRSPVTAEVMRPCHLSKLISRKGDVSPLCADEPRMVDLRRETWTGRPDKVTCPECLKRMTPAT